MMLELPDAAVFYETVWEIVRQIPEAQVSTYGQIASMIPPPQGIDSGDYDRLGARWVGDAMNAVSRTDDETIPWHRVVNSKGGISLPEESKAAALQRARLRHENVTFDKKERIDLNQFGWEGPKPAWVEAHGLYTPKSLRDTPPDTDAPQQLSLF
jgi:methylated-DNA-protein-cysteine methyltransferase-like protein